MALVLLLNLANADVSSMYMYNIEKLHYEENPLSCAFIMLVLPFFWLWIVLFGSFNVLGILKSISSIVVRPFPPSSIYLGCQFQVRRPLFVSYFLLPIEFLVKMKSRFTIVVRNARP